MPRKKISMDDPFLTPVPNTCSLTETRSYNALLGRDQRGVTVRFEIQVPLSEKAVGVQLLEQTHETFRTQLGENDRPVAEIANGRVRQYRQYFASESIALANENHETPPILAEIEKKKKGA